MITKQRLEFGAQLLDSIDVERRSKNDPSIFAAIEARIIRRELDELEAEWQMNAAPHTV
jgi:hypothetical protein